MERRVDSPLTPNPKIFTQYPQPLIPLSGSHTLINSPSNVLYFLQTSLDSNEFRFGVLGCMCQDLTDEEWVSGYSLHWALASSLLLSSFFSPSFWHPPFLCSFALSLGPAWIVQLWRSWNLEREDQRRLHGEERCIEIERIGDLLGINR
jgi:hypothetical protein